MKLGVLLLSLVHGPKCASSLLKDGLHIIDTVPAIIAIDSKNVDLSFRPPEVISGWINQRRRAPCIYIIAAVAADSL